MNNKNTQDDLDVSEAEINLYYYLIGKAGIFNNVLFETIFHADFCNLERLKAGFEDEVQVVKRYKTEKSYAKKLKSRVKAVL